MKINDLVQYQEKRWIVRHLGELEATLQDGEGKNLSIALDVPDLLVIANPPEDWPYLMVRDHPKGRFIASITRTVNRARTWLTKYVDWVPSDPARPGGAVFFNPDLDLKPAETLIINWAAAHATGITVPIHFGTVAQKVAQVVAEKPQPATVYDRLLEDRFEDDE